MSGSLPRRAGKGTRQGHRLTRLQAAVDDILASVAPGMRRETLRAGEVRGYVIFRVRAIVAARLRDEFSEPLRSIADVIAGADEKAALFSIKAGRKFLSKHTYDRREINGLGTGKG